MKKVYNSIICLALLLHCLEASAKSFPNVPPGIRSGKSTGLKKSSLQTPAIEYLGPVEQTDISMGLSNHNSGSVTEVYRSTNQTTGFKLIATVLSGQYNFYDRDLKPRTTFYYKIRAVNGSDVSAFSEVAYWKTHSKNYPPDFTARAIDENTVELILTDHSYNDNSYFIGSNTTFYKNVALLDSGKTARIIHHPVDPATTYFYSVALYPECCEQNDQYNIARASATTPGLAACAGIGFIEREKWNNVSGYFVSSIPVNSTPGSITVLDGFSSPVNDGDNFGARVRGYICVPQNGSYTFWISSDDNSELWLSTDQNPANKKLIASSKWTLSGEWNKYPSQQSAPITLTAGKYYIEALHKEALKDDHLDVGWRLPDGTMERPIPGKRLIKFERANYRPTVKITKPTRGELVASPATIEITADAYDIEGHLQQVDFYSGNQWIGYDYSAPYTFTWQNVAAGNYTIQAVVTDNEGAQSIDKINITVTGGCNNTGTMYREFWFGVPGQDMGSIDWTSPPMNYDTHTSFESAQNVNDNYASRMRGWLCVPITGNYTFWISSDDKSELYLSIDDKPQYAQLIAAVETFTPFRKYDKFARQKSVPISLVGGRTYYVEARHKEATGSDFISVGWQLPDGTLERPIPGNRIVPFTVPVRNEGPKVAITSPADRQNFPNVPSSFPVNVNATDNDGKITKVEVKVDGVIMGEDFSAPYQVQLNNMKEGSYYILVTAYDNSGSAQVAYMSVSVGNINQTCPGSGKIIREVWTGITGTSVSAIPVNSPPGKTQELTSFETQNFYGNDYGDRIRGYICVPRTGAYKFYIASDDDGELWLSTDENPANKKKIAYLNIAVPPRTWTTFNTSQQSELINLVGGRKYYIETLHKEGGGADHVSVAWQYPDGTFEGPIPGKYLIPYNQSTRAASAGVTTLVSEEAQDNMMLYPNPTTNREVKISISGKTIKEASNANLEIISMTGKVIHAQTISCTDNCDDIIVTFGNNVTPGVYLVNVLMNRKRLSKKLQVK